MIVEREIRRSNGRVYRITVKFTSSSYVPPYKDCSWFVDVVYKDPGGQWLDIVQRIKKGFYSSAPVMNGKDYESYKLSKIMQHITQEELDSVSHVLWERLRPNFITWEQ